MERVTLKNGVKMPQIGFGVLQLKDAELCESCVGTALQSGYRMVDTASAYFNEAAVGNAVKQSGIPREEVFLISKLWIQDSSFEKTKQALEHTLGELGTDYLDLYLIHHPFGDYYDAWRAMETLYEEGKVRAIGVSNFDEARLTDLCLNSRIAPMVDQIELHPFHQQEHMLRVMMEYQVTAQAWAPFCEGQKMIFEHKEFEKIAKKYHKTTAQVILRWNIERGVSVLPGSSDAAHIHENMDIWDFELSNGDKRIIEQLDLGYSEIIDHNSACTARWLNEWKIHET